jgi:carbon storage regulator CsrA
MVVSKEGCQGMLVLTRRLHEKVLLPDIRTSVEVSAIKGNIVRLAFQAPSGVTILREELYAAGVRAGSRGQPLGERFGTLRGILACLRSQAEQGTTALLLATIDRLEQEIALLRQSIGAAESPRRTGENAETLRRVASGETVLRS